MIGIGKSGCLLGSFGGRRVMVEIFSKIVGAVDTVNIKRVVILMVILLISIIQIQISFAVSNVSVHFQNGTEVSYLSYERDNQSWGTHPYGSNSYADYTVINPDVLMTICHDNLTLWQKFDLAYTSESGNITKSILNILPQTSSYTNYSSNSSSYNCSEVNIDISSMNALYPGYATPYLYTGLYDITTINTTTTINGTNVTNHTNISTPIAYSFPDDKIFLNGSYLLAINVEAPPKTYYISTQEIYDEDGIPITTNARRLVTTLVDNNDTIISENTLAPQESFSYTGTFSGGEKIYVNGIMSLELKIYDPCSPINESGYYILNQSSWNTNSSCIIIENLTNIVFNFAGEVIDGDNSTNGSLAPDNCPIIIRNSDNITIEDLRTQQYLYGICVYNSSVRVFGNSSTSNSQGALVQNDSSASFYSIYFSNNDSEIVAADNSKVTLDDVSFTSAEISAEFKDAIVKAVNDPPEAPGNAIDIDQWIHFLNNSFDTWAQISFVYSEPLPNYVVANNISIFKYNGTYITNSSTSNITNVTTTWSGWVNGTWLQLYTLVSPSENLIIGPNVTNFSVFAPFGFETEPEPEPEPEPTPDPKPQAGSKRGSGGKLADVQENKDVPIFAEPIKLKLYLPDNATAMQGEAISIPFNLSNVGNVTATDIVISPEQFQGWDVSPKYIDSLTPGKNISGTFEIAPFEKATPRSYLLEVDTLVLNDTKIRSDLMHIIVTPRGNLSRIRVLEYPPVIEMEPDSTETVSFLVENIGDGKVTDVFVEVYDNACLAGIEGANTIDKGETKVISYKFTSKSSGDCNYNIKFYDDGKLVGFVPVRVKVVAKESGSDLVKRSLLLVLLALWTLLTIYIISKKRNRSLKHGGKK